MRIYDGKTPHGRKVDRPGEKVICPQCQGRDGRHVLVKTRKTKKAASNGQTIVYFVDEMCPRGK